MFFFFPQLHPFSSQNLVVAIVLDMPVVVHGAVAVCYTIAAGHMNFALDYCSQQTSPLLSILSIYYMNNFLFPFPHSFKLRIFSYYENILFSHKVSVIVSMIAAAPAIANNASNGSATIGINYIKLIKSTNPYTCTPITA